MTSESDYERWLETVPGDITSDTLWRMSAYRFSLFAMWVAQQDVPFLLRHRETRGLIDQMLRAVGAISANLEEGYGHSSPRERAHFYEYALCTGRESRGWYYKCAIAFPPEILADRMGRFTRIIRILTAVVPEERESGMDWTVRRQKGSRGQSQSTPAARSTSK